ncbi:MAG: SPOR domain-containing protein [Halioglobus sp.]|nr:SPOR domain-containing protein [Halioglobus sp.]
MNDILKQRLVGALILVALGVVFWPIIFLQPDNETALYSQSTTVVQAARESDLRVPPSPTALDDISGQSELAAADAVVEVVPSTASSEQLVVDSDGMPVAWTLQVITVSSADKAEVLREQLLDMQHQAYILTVRSNGKKLYRVCIGPKFERAELETLQATINAQFKVNSIVARYIP